MERERPITHDVLVTALLYASSELCNGLLVPDPTLYENILRIFRTLSGSITAKEEIRVGAQSSILRDDGLRTSTKFTIQKEIYDKDAYKIIDQFKLSTERRRYQFYSQLFISQTGETLLDSVMNLTKGVIISKPSVWPSRKPDEYYWSAPYHYPLIEEIDNDNRPYWSLIVKKNESS